MSPTAQMTGPGRHAYDPPGEHGQKGDTVPRLYPTVLRYVAERKALGELQGKSPRDTQARLTLFATATGPDLQIGRLTDRHIKTWVATLTVCPSTLYQYLSTVRTFTRWAVAEGLIRRDPCAGIRGPRKPQSLPRSMPPADVERLIQACPDLRAVVFTLLLFQEACRISEVLHLQVGDIDLDARLVRVMGKGAKERFVPLSDETADAVDAYLQSYPASPSKPLIRSYTNPERGVSDSYMRKVFRVAAYQAGVKKRPYDGKSPHCGRHTCANDMLDRGADLRDVQEMLGHEHLSTTTIYTKRERAMSRLRVAAAGRQYRPDRTARDGSGNDKARDREEPGEHGAC